MTKKKCIDCGETKPHAAFYAHRASKDGHQSRCKPCDNARRMGNYRRGTGQSRDVIRREDGSLVFVKRGAAT